MSNITFLGNVNSLTKGTRDYYPPRPTTDPGFGYIWVFRNSEWVREKGNLSYGGPAVPTSPWLIPPDGSGYTPPPPTPEKIPEKKPNVVLPLAAGAAAVYLMTR